VVCRWFLGLGLTDKVPDASTLSANRTRCFKEADVYQKIFGVIVLQAMKKKLASGRSKYENNRLDT